MKVKLLTTFLVLAAVSTSPIVFSTPASSATPAPKTLKLLWSDEFSAKKVSLPNPKNWDFDIGNSYGWGNSELEYYTNKTSNVSQDGKGHLIITANRISDAAGTQVGTAAGTPQILNICYECQFTSAKLKTANRLGFKYGRIEARMKLPSGLGTWPAFWMLGADLLDGNGWPECGEIDVLEARGDLPPVAYGTLHGPNFGNGGGYGNTFTGGDPLASAYHVYAVEWKKNRVDMYVDDNLYFSATPADVAPGRWVFNHEFFLILNLAMGGEFTGDLDPAMSQAKLSVDYIRYYSVNGVGTLYKHSA
jgi:beta-glucanase (GH16 family)